MSRIAVFGGTGYLASLIKNQNNIDHKKYTFFSRKKKSKNYINFFAHKKNINTFKNYDIIIHLVGANKNQVNRNHNLIEKKNRITSSICDLCLKNNIKLIYISSMQVYKGYGKNNITINSKINFKNPYSKSHYKSEKTIMKKFKNHKNMFTILRLGNIFGFKKFHNLKEISNNLIHKLCILALNKKQILIENGSIERTFIPSKIFIKLINLIIDKNIFNNSIENISYKNLNLEKIALIIQKRFMLLFNFKLPIKIKKFSLKKKFKVQSSLNFKFNAYNTEIYFEIDQILKYIESR